MNPVGFADASSAVLTLLAAAVPFPMVMVSRKSDDDFVVLCAYDREYGFVQGDVIPWHRALCSTVLNGHAPQAVPDVEHAPALAAAAAGLRMDVGAWITVPMLGPDGELYGTVCAGDPQRHDGELREEFAHVRRAAAALGLLLEQQIRLDEAERRIRTWQHGASSDLLTGLATRRLWEDQLPDVDARCAALGSRAAVIVLDVDGLRDTNERQGHAAGDALLRTTGEVLRTELDAAHVLARTGDDEFAAVLVEVDHASAHAAADRVRTALEQRDIRVSVGVGLRTPDMTAAQAWHVAESGLHVDRLARSQALRGGGDRPAGVSPESAAARQESVADLLREVREALGLQVAFVSRFTEGQRLIEAVDASCPVPLQVGDSHPEEMTYCHAIVQGDLPRAIPDTAAHPLTAALPLTRDLGIGSYVGVPILMADGEVYGTLCAYADEARGVDERDTALLQLVARTLGLQLSSPAEDRAEETPAHAWVREVLDDDLLTAVYQPVVDLSTGLPVAVEGLARFPARFGRRPDQWFADAADSGQGTALELAAAKKAVAGLQDLPDGVAVAVNVSAAVVVSPAFLAWLGAAPLERMVLELTEHEQVDDYAALNAALQPARDNGLRLAVDDAGAGYASMRHWLMLRPDLLKLDLSLVRHVDQDPVKRSLCHAIITFAHSTGTQVIAEGVETQAEYDAVRALGADFAQGYLLQRPAPLNELELEAPAEAASTQTSADVVLATIREMALAGCSSATIAARLNALGQRRDGGVRWHARSVEKAERASQVVERPPTMDPGRGGSRTRSQLTSEPYRLRL